MARESAKRYSLSIQNQTDFTTFPLIGSAGDWESLDLMEPPTITYARQIEARPDAPTGSAGAGRPPVVGSRHGGTITFRMEVKSMDSGYSAASAVPVFNVDPVTSTNPQFNLIATFLTGTDIGANQAAGSFAASLNTANNIEMNTGTLKPGVGYMHDEDGAGDLQWFVPSDLTSTSFALLEDYQGIASDMSGARGIPSITFSPETAPSPTFHTFLLENDLSLAEVLHGAYHQTSTLTMNPGEPWMWEHTFGFTAHKKIVSSIGIIAAVQHNTVPAAMDVTNGRANIGGYGDQDGSFSAAGDTQCINALSVTFTSSNDMVKCHGHAGGSFQDVSDMVLTDLDVKITMTVAHEDALDDATNLDTDWDVYLDNQTSKSITCYTGNTEGFCAAFVVPQAHLVEQPQKELVGDALVGYTLVWEPGPFTADDDTDAGDTAVRFMLA